jgi:ATP-dependent Clp protease ATP-binding subunit ClpA
MANAVRASFPQVLERARDEAAVLGSPSLEAEHVLLALAALNDPVVNPLLAGTGIDREALRRAIEAQGEAALAAVGVSRAAFNLPPMPRLTRSPLWGTSSKQAIIRAKQIATARHERRVLPAHLLLGVLAAEAGTAVRALDAAGADRAELAAATTAALDKAGSAAR